MDCRLTDLRMKEVINTADGSRLGCVSDVILEIPEGRVVALVVPGPCKMMGVLGRSDDFVIPWCSVKRIGADTILVEIERDKCKTPRPKKGLI